MRIVGARVVEMRLAFRRPFVTAAARVATRRGFLLHLTSDAGVEGVGEASPATWIGETAIEQVAGDLRRVLADVCECPDAARLRALTLSAAAACAVDTALLDLDATTRGVAGTALLGGDSTATLAVSALLTGDTADALRRDAEKAAARGFRTLKIKVGVAALADDVARVEAVRRTVGDRVALRLDANRAWTFAQARAALAAFAPLGIELLEEPLRVPRPRDLAALAAGASIPLALDESVSDATALEEAMSAGGVSALVVKTARVGGPTPAVALARVAARRGLRVVVTDSIESPVGMRAALHVAAALAEPRLAVGLGGASLLAEVDPDFDAPMLRAAGPGFAVAPVEDVESVARA
jgi:o-succinylbenzoate synthase